MEWLPESRHVDPINVSKALSDFGEEDEQKRNVAKNIMTSLSQSDAGFLVSAANKYPLIMKYLPTLLPGQFLDLLNKGKDEELEKKRDTDISVSAVQDERNTTMLAKLEDVLKMDAWKLGFNHIIFKDLHLVRCEAKLQAFKDCGIYNKMASEKQDALLLYDCIKAYCRDSGHTYIDRDHLEWRLRCNMQEERTWETLAFLRKHGVLIVDRQKIALQNLYMYETDIAACLETLVNREPWRIELDVREVLLSMQRQRMRGSAEAATGTSASAQCAEEREEAMEEELDPAPEVLDPDQVRAAEMMCANPVVVISGKGGCGKTAVVSCVFKAAMDHLKKTKEAERHAGKDEAPNGEGEAPPGEAEGEAPPGEAEGEAPPGEAEGEAPPGEAEGEAPPGEAEVEVLLTAPTGRAASLLSKRTSFNAYTMHQILWNFRHTSKDKLLNWKFAHVRVLVVDEGSLVCVQMLQSILKILTEHAQLQKFIILGDVRQLPSIAPGNVLNDLFNGLRRVNWAIEMRTNHRAESQLIVSNAGLIADMGEKKMFCSLNFDAVVDLRTVPVISPDKKFILIRLPQNKREDDLQTAIKLLLDGPAPGLKDDRTSQFVAFKRDECALINELCCIHYSQHHIMTDKRRKDFQIKDKVCCTRNGYVALQDHQGGEEEKKDKQRLCNGEIFFIADDVTTQEGGKVTRRKLTLESDEAEDGRRLIVDYRELNRECKLQHGWARTIHTFQGSEAETVVYVVGDSKYETWKHVYTAVTRGRARVYVIAREDSLEKAIKTQVIRRNTRLAGLVTEMAARHGPARGDRTGQARAESPVPGSGSGPVPLPHPSAGPTQTHPAVMSEYGRSPDRERRGQSVASACSDELGPLQSGSPAASKRQSSVDNCTTPNKSLKTAATDSPLGCSRLGRLSLDGLHRPRRLYLEHPPPCQDQTP
ncbi:DNA helicase B isoform X2 [Brachyhypopomus gauderio]